ncbi:MAG: hypothetical protein RI949_2304, partial [Pseudomonadota bacterium]
MHGGLKIADKVRAMRAFKGLRRLSSWVNQVLGGSAGGSLLSSAPFFAQLTKSLVLNRGTGSPTFTRATTATVTDNEGILRTAIAGEARFTGARRVYNRVVGASENLTNAAWVGVNATSPNATTVLASAGNAPHYRRQIQAANAAGSVWIIQAKLTAGTHNCAVLGDDGDASYHSVSFDLSLGTKGQEQNATGAITPLGGGQYLCTAKFTRTNAGTVRPCIGLVTNASTTIDGGLNAAGTETIIAEEIQLEDITGRTDQTTPSEYVSVGALDYRSTQDPLYLSLPGTAGHYASTPDSVAASITGDIDIRVKCAPTDWTPAAFIPLVAKYAAGQYSYILYLNDLSDGKLLFNYTTDGSTPLSALATVGVGFTDGATGWVRATRQSSSGDVKFYTSTNGETWTQIGTTVSTTAGSMFDGTAPLRFGEVAAAQFFNGKVFQAQIYNTIGGTTPVVDFNPQRDAVTPTGTITSSTTGEVWTINGASSVVRNAAYHGTGVDGVKCFDTDLSGNPIPSSTLKGYLAEGAA